MEPDVKKTEVFLRDFNDLSKPERQARILNTKHSAFFLPISLHDVCILLYEKLLLLISIPNLQKHQNE